MALMITPEVAEKMTLFCFVSRIFDGSFTSIIKVQVTRLLDGFIADNGATGSAGYVMFCYQTVGAKFRYTSQQCLIFGLLSRWVLDIGGW
jgi:hypothetical protein